MDVNFFDTSKETIVWPSVGMGEGVPRIQVGISATIDYTCIDIHRNRQLPNGDYYEEWFPD